MALTFGVHLAFPLWIAFPLAVILSRRASAACSTSALWKPLRKQGLGIVQLMIVSIGLSLALRYIFQYFYRRRHATSCPDAGSAQDHSCSGPIALSVTDMISMGISIVVLVGVAYWLLRTRTGKATRAISDNPSLAAASGIDVDRVIRLSGSSAAPLAGLVRHPLGVLPPGHQVGHGLADPAARSSPRSSSAASAPRSAPSSARSSSACWSRSRRSWIPSDIKYVGALAVLIVVLLFRPQGILGRKERIG